MDPRDDIRQMLAAEAQERQAAADAGRILRLADVPTAAELPEQRVDWLVEGMIPQGGITLLAGESGTYKTWLALVLARSVVAGLDFLGRKCRTAPVLYLDRENPVALMHERLRRLGMEKLSGLHLWGGWLSEPPPVIGDARLGVMAREDRPLVIFDSFIRFHEQDENSATMMATVMSELRLLANAGATVVVLHHKPKGEGSQYRGSSDIRAGVDVAFAVSTVGCSAALQGGSSSSRLAGGNAANPAASAYGDSASDAPARLLKFICFKNRLAPEFALTLRPELETHGDFALAESPAAARHSDDIARLRELIAAHPGLTQTELIGQSGVPERRLPELLRQHEGTLWRKENGPRGSFLFFPVESSLAESPETSSAIQ